MALNARYCYKHNRQKRLNTQDRYVCDGCVSDYHKARYIPKENPIPSVGRPPVPYCAKHQCDKQLKGQNRYKCTQCVSESSARCYANKKVRRESRKGIKFCRKHSREKELKYGCHGSYYYCTQCNSERQIAYRALRAQQREAKVRPPSKQQIALELSDLGYTIQEIAEQMGCTLRQASCFRSKASLSSKRREQQEHPGPSDEPYYLDEMDKKAEEVWARKADPQYYGIRAVWHSSAIREMEISL